MNDPGRKKTEDPIHSEGTLLGQETDVHSVGSTNTLKIDRHFLGENLGGS